MAEIKTADNMIAYLKTLARATPEKTLHHTCDARVLKALLLDTGGELKTIISGTVYHYSIETKHLGVGVYNVWLERKDK